MRVFGAIRRHLPAFLNNTVAGVASGIVVTLLIGWGLLAWLGPGFSSGSATPPSATPPSTSATTPTRRADAPDFTGLRTSAFIPTTPLMVIDTRMGDGPLAPEVAKTIQLTAVPYGAVAVNFNLLATNTVGDGPYRVWAADAVEPDAGILFVAAGQSLSTSAVTPLSASGAIKVKSEGGGDVRVVVTGYWLPTASTRSGRFMPSAERLYDSRTSDGPTEPGTVHRVQVLGVVEVVSES
jgi:hypothetical protein